MTNRVVPIGSRGRVPNRDVTPVATVSTIARAGHDNDDGKEESDDSLKMNKGKSVSDFKLKMFKAHTKDFIVRLEDFLVTQTRGCLYEMFESILILPIKFTHQFIYSTGDSIPKRKRQLPSVSTVLLYSVLMHRSITSELDSLLDGCICKINC